MKGTVHTLKEKAGSTLVRSAAAVTALVPIAGILGGMNLGNHNETVLRTPVA